MINKRPPSGYTDPMQPQDLEAMVPGIGTSGIEDLAKRPDSDNFSAPREHPDNDKANGDNRFGGK